MDTERLQEIKIKLDKEMMSAASHIHVDELITALEAAQADAATWQNTAEELGRQLAEAQAELAEQHKTICRRNATISAHATSSEGVRKVTQDLRAQLAEAQEAIEKFRYEMPELRPDEL